MSDEAKKEELKVVITIKGRNALLGVQSPDCDPVFQTIMATTLEQAVAAAPALVELARIRWATSPRNPRYDRPTPPPPPPLPIRPAAPAAAPVPKQVGDMVQKSLR